MGYLLSKSKKCVALLNQVVRESRRLIAKRTAMKFDRGEFDWPSAYEKFLLDRCNEERTACLYS